MSAQVSIQSVDAAGQTIYVSFNVTLSGNYPTGGDPLNFTSSSPLPVTQDPAFIGLVAAIESSQLLQVDVWSQNRGAINGANTTNYSPVKSSTNPATGTKLVVSALTAQGTSKDAEHAASAYEAAYLNDLVTGWAIFSKLL